MNDSPSDIQTFEFMDMFNQIIVADDAIADTLPVREFELSFDATGNVYVDGQPLGINVKQRYEALQVR